MHKIIFVLLFLLLTCLASQATPKQKYSRQDVLSANVAETMIGKRVTLRDSYTYEGTKLLACLFSAGTKSKPQDVLFIWRQTSKGFELLHQRESLPGETYEKPVVFKSNNLSFLNISTEPAGSGGFVEDTMLWLAPDGTGHEVDFEQASEVFEGLAGAHKVVMTGGEREFFFQDDQMKFQFWIAQEGDPHCCPSGGAVTGTYRVQGSPKYDYFTRRYSADFKILVDQMQHLSNDSAESRLSSAP